MIFIEYPACGTCQKARKWLTERGITVHTRHIVEESPTENELKEWIKRSGLPIKKFFNTSGLVYRELELKDRLPTMSTEDQIALLSSNGKLVKRPLLIGTGVVLVGFNIEEWTRALK